MKLLFIDRLLREILFIRVIFPEKCLWFRFYFLIDSAVFKRIKIADNMGVTGRTKHFSDAIHYFRHVVEHRVVVPTFVRTNVQHADGFTKALGKGPFRAWQQLLYRC